MVATESLPWQPREYKENVGIEGGEECDTEVHGRGIVKSDVNSR